MVRAGQGKVEGGVSKSGTVQGHLRVGQGKDVVWLEQDRAKLGCSKSGTVQGQLRMGYGKGRAG